MPYRQLLSVAVLGAAILAAVAQAQTPGINAPAGGGNAAGKAASAGKSDIEFVERLLTARRDYQTSLEKLRQFYIQAGDVERTRWVEDELIQYHRSLKPAYRLELDVPPPTLEAKYNVPEANELYRKAMLYKDKGWNTDYIDNQRRAEMLLQQLLTNYPQCDKIDDAAYMLGDVYESKAYRQFRRAAYYFERCFQWNPNTQFDARLRAARLYDKQLIERAKAVQLYREVLTHETDPKRMAEAQKRVEELNANR